MPIVRILETTSAQRTVFTDMRRVLLQAGAERPSEQAGRRSHVGSHRASAWEPWPGASAGVRAPGAGETPLSAAEVAHGFRSGVLA